MVGARVEGNLVRHNNINGRTEFARWKTRALIASNFKVFSLCSKRMEGGGTEEFLITFFLLDSNLEDIFCIFFFLGNLALRCRFCKQNKVISFVSMDSIADFFFTKELVFFGRFNRRLLLCVCVCVFY